MRMRVLFSALSLTAVVPYAKPLDCQNVERSGSIYVVAEYDSSRDPLTDLEMAVERAQAEGKRILLEVGGAWCIWCQILDSFIEADSLVAERLAESFVVVKVNYSTENRNQPFLSRYPDIPGYPHFFVLESDGSFLHSQPTEELEEGDSYSESAFLGFLEAWAPSVDRSERD